MAASVETRSEKAGLAPGTLVHMGRPKPGGTRVEVAQYDATRLERRDVATLDQCLVDDAFPVTWVNVDGLGEPDVLQHFGSCYGIHPLVLEDILATDQRPKAADYGDYLYVVLKMIVPDPTGEIRSEQVSMVLGQNYLISFQEGLEGDVFEPVRSRLANEKARVRGAGPDFLLHALLDVIIDHYFLVLERLSDRIEEVEEELIHAPSPATAQAIYRLKRQMLFLGKAVWPLREVLGSLQRRDSQLIRGDTVIYLRDLYDHTVQVLDTLETLREMLSGMLDIYLSSMSNRLNEVMKVLTIIATIFMPLSFLVGLYGMNFKYMPELDWNYGYFAVLLLCFAIAAGMLIYFRKKRWI